MSDLLSSPSATGALSEPDTTLVMTRHYNAPRERVFDALTDPAQITSWFAPTGKHCDEVIADPQPGGGYSIAFTDRDGDGHKVAGHYEVVKPPSLLVFTWAWVEGSGPRDETQVTMELEEEDGGTRFTLTHRRFADSHIRDLHNKGWGPCLDHLGRLVEAAAP
ncbi:SRPBCC family protein [Rhodovibrionaceae bacterium A322]